jgi:hypothetical protein
MLVLGILALAAAGLAAIGLLVQKWCRLDEPPTDPFADDRRDQREAD